MVEHYELETKSIPWKYLDRFNAISGLEIPRHDDYLKCPGLLGRSCIRESGGGGVGILQAEMSKDRRGFCDGLAYTCGMEEKYPAIKQLAAKLHNATRETIGRRITTKYKKA